MAKFIELSGSEMINLDNVDFIMVVDKSRNEYDYDNNCKRIPESERLIPLFQVRFDIGTESYYSESFKKIEEAQAYFDKIKRKLKRPGILFYR
ncbi:MAG: hypothetical protein ACYCUW_01690 [bacterium]